MTWRSYTLNQSVVKPGHCTSPLQCTNAPSFHISSPMFNFSLVPRLNPQRSVWWHSLETLGFTPEIESDQWNHRVALILNSKGFSISVSPTVCVLDPFLHGLGLCTRLLAWTQLQMEPSSCQHCPTITLTSLIPRLAWEWGYQLTLSVLWWYHFSPLEDGVRSCVQEQHIFNSALCMWSWCDENNLHPWVNYLYLFQLLSIQG